MTAVEIMAESQLGEDVTDEEADKIVAFLHSLTGQVPEVTFHSSRQRQLTRRGP